MGAGDGGDIPRPHPARAVQLPLYNQDLTTGSLLIEVGGHGNNLNEALYAGQLAAEGLIRALQ